MQELIHEYGSEFDWESNSGYINDNLKQTFFQDAEYFRSGRDALKAIALKYKGQYKRVLLPALCCKSMVRPFEMNGYDISYYKLNQDISADFEDILSKMQSNVIFLYINYFGALSLSDEKLNLIQKRFENSIIVEDRTHDILTHRINKFTPNYIVFSIRKWIAIPDGGILYSSSELSGFPKEKDTYFGDIRIRALKNKSEYLKSGNIQIKTLFRNKLAEANCYLDTNDIVADILQESYELLQHIDFKKIAQQRRENAQVLSQLLKNIGGVKSITSDVERSFFYYPILIENRDAIQLALAEKNIYCPIIWPMPKRAVGLCKVSDYISEHMLALPCDQRYKTSDMRHIVGILKRILGE